MMLQAELTLYKAKKKQNKQTTKEVIAFRSVNRKAQQKIRTLFGYWADQGLKGLALHPLNASPAALVSHQAMGGEAFTTGSEV